jgi:hypothetical protein
MLNQIMKGDAMVPAKAGKTGGVLVDVGFPDFFQYLLKNRVYSYSQAAAGVVMNAPGAGADTIWTLINPAGSGRIFIPLELTVGYVDTTFAPGNLGLFYQNNVGGAYGTGAPIVSFTAATPLSCLIGATADSKMWFAPASENLTGASSLLYTFGLNSATGTAADTRGVETWRFNFKEAPTAVKPGSLIQIASNAAMAAKLVVGVIGVEIDETEIA